MKRIARISRLKPGAEARYEELHAAVWPGVVSAIRKAGIRNYTIFRRGELLFSYLELPDGARDEEAWACLDTPECRRWEALMEPLRLNDGSGAWQPMTEIWHLE